MTNLAGLFQQVRKTDTNMLGNKLTHCQHMHSCDHCFFLTVELSCVCAVVCITHMHSCSHILVLTDVCRVCGRARLLALSFSSSRGCALSELDTALCPESYFLNTRGKAMHAHTLHSHNHSLTHAHHCRYSLTHHMDISRKVYVNGLT
jgi:hypothetical protein